MAMATPRDTGASNVEYDLISVLYHELQGNETLARYEQDAREVGDNEAAQFFHDVRESNKEFVNRGRNLLNKRMGR